MKKNTTLYWLMAAVIVLLGIAAFLYTKNYRQSEVIQAMNDQFEYEKEALEEDYSRLALQYEDYGIRISNDSLAGLLDQERAKNQRLAEEIKTLKINNARRLTELRRELETARGVMRSYIIQIDSLNTANTRLKEENRSMSRQYRAAREEVTALAKEKAELTEKVMLASMLEARDISVRQLTNKGRATTRLNRTTQLEFQAVISKNISAPVGQKTVYLRITRPDGLPLLKENAQTFAFEGSQLPFSASRNIEYDGEEAHVTIYWDVQEYLDAGTYRADFFADGYLIGSREFVLGK
ncbi:MAG: hypothetical protein IJ154_01105 [Bacteroidales bacterium]|nr:hypothetical protein [Bacteroidales bacterium]